MAYPIPDEVLRNTRELAKISQASLAKRLSTVPSVLSRLEKAEEAEPEMAERYLGAIDSDLSRDILDYYRRAWFQEKPPSYLHPDREVLWVIDQALADLDAFQKEKADDPILRGPIDLLRDELHAAEVYLKRRDHVVAWVGDIGVGKTTALTYAAGLLIGDGRSGRRPAFPVGSGRTTVCETAIRVAPTFGILVDAVDDDEVVRLTRDLVSSLAPGASGVGVSSEIARVLRNMSGMRVSNSMAGDELVVTDPIADLIAQGVGVDEVTDRVVQAMRLVDRNERQIILPEGSEDGLVWISRLVSNINSGLDARFGVPRRITVLMPSRNLSEDGQVLQVVDTRGIESVTQRPDLAVHNEDPRALVVLCTKFADAPNATVQRQLQEAIDAGSDAAQRKRQCILVLPRGDEALELPGYDTPLTSREQGYTVRRKEVEQALMNADLPKIPVYFFDARNDDADKIWSTLRRQISDMRAVYGVRARAAADGVVNLRNNVDHVRAAEARRDIQHELDRTLNRAAELDAIVRPAHLNLIDQMAVGHHSSIAASIVRRGDWDSFQFDHILGQGVRIDANQRTFGPTSRIEHKLDDLQEKYADLVTVSQSLTSLKERLAEWRQEFLATARAIGRDAYGSLLTEQAEVWNESVNRYGMGTGYKRDVAEIWRSWFETDERVHTTSRAVSARLQDAWMVHVIDPLRKAMRSEPDP